MKERVSVWAAFNYGLQATGRHFWFLLGIYFFSCLFLLAVFLPGVALNIGFFNFLLSAAPASATQESIEAFQALFIGYLFESWVTFVSIFVTALLVKIVFDIVWLGLFRVTLDLHDTGKSNIKRLLSCAGIFYRYTIASLLFYIIVSVGFLFLLVPGIIFALRFGFFPHFLVDKNVGIIESLKLSWKRTHGHTWALFFLVLLFGAVISLLHIVLLIISNTAISFGPLGNWLLFFVKASAITYAFFTISLTWTYAYRRLNKEITITDDLL